MNQSSGLVQGCYLQVRLCVNLELFSNITEGIELASEMDSPQEDTVLPGPLFSCVGPIFFRSQAPRGFVTIHINHNHKIFVTAPKPEGFAFCLRMKCFASYLDTPFKKRDLVILGISEGCLFEHRIREEVHQPRRDFRHHSCSKYSLTISSVPQTILQNYPYSTTKYTSSDWSTQCWLDSEFHFRIMLEEICEIFSFGLFSCMKTHPLLLKKKIY